MNFPTATATITTLDCDCILVLQGTHQVGDFMDCDDHCHTNHTITAAVSGPVVDVIHV